MAQRMTLGQLLESSGDRKLQLVSGDPSALDRPVRGVHSTEMDHPTLWVEGGWVVLTSGLALKRQPDKRRRLVAELDEAGVTALGFGVGSAFSVVPKALVEEARRRGFPVFVIPWDVSFRDMIRDVYEAQLSSDVRGYLRLVSMQHHLLDALADEAPQDTVIERLSSLVDATVAVLGPGGRVIRATGELPAAAFWEELSSRRPMVAEFDADGWHGVGVPLPGTGASSMRWLVVGTRRREFASPLTKRVAQITAPLLSAMRRIDNAASQQEREIKGSLLEALLGASRDADNRTLRARAGAFGIRLDGASRVIVVAPAGEESADGQPLIEILEDTFESLGMAALLLSREDSAVALAEPASRNDWPALWHALANAVEAYRIGAGRPVDSVAAVPESHRDAVLAAKQVRTETPVLTYEDLDPDALLVAEVAPDRWRAKMQSFMEPLREHPQLRETLVAYFDHDLDVVATATTLHLHSNSLRYRLRRVEELLGRSLREPSTIATLQFARLALGDDLIA
jgi:PucR family transcriptional regulator, purine catabolism regulatory protein